MKKLYGFALAAILTVLCVSSIASVRQVARVLEDTQLFDAPEGAPLASIPKGDEITIIQWGDHPHVKYGQYDGYVRKGALSPAAMVETFDQPLRGKLNADGVNLRQRPDTDSQIFSILKKGADVEISESCDGYFKVRCEKQRGYVLQSYCDVPGYEGTAYPTLKMGCEGALVSNIQRALIAKGYLAGEPTAKYGSTTRDAIRAFELDNGFAADGIADTAVLLLLLGDKDEDTILVQ